LFHDVHSCINYFELVVGELKVSRQAADITEMIFGDFPILSGHQMERKLNTKRRIKARLAPRSM